MLKCSNLFRCPLFTGTQCVRRACTIEPVSTCHPYINSDHPGAAILIASLLTAALASVELVTWRSGGAGLRIHSRLVYLTNGSWAHAWSPEQCNQCQSRRRDFSNDFTARIRARLGYYRAPARCSQLT